MLTDFNDIWWECIRLYSQLIRLCSVLRPRQHSIGYMGDGFSGQKTQPTVSKYWRKENTQITEKYNKHTDTQYSKSPSLHVGWLEAPTEGRVAKTERRWDCRGTLEVFDTGHLRVLKVHSTSAANHKWSVFQTRYFPYLYNII